MADPRETPKPVRVLVTGSRTWNNLDAVWGTLKTLADEHGSDRLVIVHGHCKQGADKLADDYGRNYGIKVERHPANWRLYQNRAGFRRNAEMVALGADVCLAFIDPCTKPGCREPKPHGSHGAAHTADLAEKAGIPTRRFPEERRA